MNQTPESDRPAIGATYTTRPGDTISELAFAAYGDARRYASLAEHNSGVPGFVAARLVPGLVIEIPEPDYLPMPSGVGGMRGGAGRTFGLRADGPPPSGLLPITAVSKPDEERDVRAQR